MAAADMFCAFFQTMELQHWDNRWGKEELSEYKPYGINYDRRLKIFDKDFFLEVDRGSEDLPDIKSKVQFYTEFSRANPDKPFWVLFTVAPYRRSNLENRIRRFLEIFDDAHRGNQFLLCPHALAKQDPLAPVWGSHIATNIALKDLVYKQRG